MIVAVLAETPELKIYAQEIRTFDWRLLQA